MKFVLVYPEIHCSCFRADQYARYVVYDFRCRELVLLRAVVDIPLKCLVFGKENETEDFTIHKDQLFFRNGSNMCLLYSEVNAYVTWSDFNRMRGAYYQPRKKYKH